MFITSHLRGVLTVVVEVMEHTAIGTIIYCHEDIISLGVHHCSGPSAEKQETDTSLMDCMEERDRE